MVRVGIPRALLFYQYFPMWHAFFRALGAEVVTTPATTRATLAAGAARVVAETCLPVKIYCGHVLDLVGKADVVFVPSLRSLERDAHHCAKLLGLPDLVRAVVPEAPDVLDVDVDLEKGTLAFYRAIYAVGRRFTWNPLRVKRAAAIAWAAHLRYLDWLQRGAGEAEHDSETGWLNDWHRGLTNVAPLPITIAVVGHAYNLFDAYACHDVLRRLASLGVAVRTPTELPASATRAAIARLVGRAYWACEAELIGAAGCFLDDPAVDALVAVIAFGCAPDSVMMDVVQRYARATGKPVLMLPIDEHTGTAGVATRLEAFVDLLTRR